MYKKIGRFTVSYPWLVCAAWLVAGVILSLVAPAWDSKTQDDDIRFLPGRCASVRGYHLFSESFPKEIFASKAIFAVERRNAKLTPQDYVLVDRMVDQLVELRKDEPGLQIGNITSYRDGLIGSRLNSADGQCTLIQVSLGTPFLALQTREAMDKADARLRKCVADAGDNAPRMMATGPAGIGRDLISASADSLEGTTVATVLLVVVVLLVVYRAPLLALIPLLTIAVSVWVSLKLLALMTLIPGVHLVNVAKIFAIVILYGSGTDYCLFLISRYKEELAEGYDTQTALARTVGTVGGALAASAGTVICGLGMMGLAEFAKVRCAGPAIGLSLAVALLASLTLAPAFLCLLGRFVFWPARRSKSETEAVLALRQENAKPPIWDRISRGVIARPALIWSIAIFVLAPLAVLGMRVKPNYKPTGELHPSRPSVQGVAAIQRHYTAGEIGPITVLLASPTEWSSPQGKELIAHLSKGFAHLPNVAEVRSLTQPLGTPLEEPTPEPASSGFLGGFLGSVRKDINRALENAHRAAREHYVARSDEDGRSVTRLDVVLKTDPFDTASVQTLDEIQLWLQELMPQSAGTMEVQAECYGVTVCSRDLAAITEADRVRVNTLVLAGILLILLLVVRRPWLAIYLLVSVLFSYYATLGATALVGTLWSHRPLGSVDWRVPFFLFTILVAVGEDYNIFLITRVLEERKKHGEEEGLRRALAHTGGTITSCGLIMAGTFATLMLGRLGTLVQIGFALGFGVLVDTFVVRPFLVPAFTLMVWRMQRKTAAERTSRPRRVEDEAWGPASMARRRVVRLPRAS
jgi:RND superfamily putative drug exporter